MGKILTSGIVHIGIATALVVAMLGRCRKKRTDSSREPDVEHSDDIRTEKEAALQRLAEWEQREEARLTNLLEKDYQAQLKEQKDEAQREVQAEYAQINKLLRNLRDQMAGGVRRTHSKSAEQPQLELPSEEEH